VAHAPLLCGHRGSRVVGLRVPSAAAILARHERPARSTRSAAGPGAARRPRRGGLRGRYAQVRGHEFDHYRHPRLRHAEPGGPRRSDLARRWLGLLHLHRRELASAHLALPDGRRRVLRPRSRRPPPDGRRAARGVERPPARVPGPRHGRPLAVRAGRGALRGPSHARGAGGLGRAAEGRPEHALPDAHAARLSAARRAPRRGTPGRGRPLLRARSSREADARERAAPAPGTRPLAARADAAHRAPHAPDREGALPGARARDRRDHARRTAQRRSDRGLGALPARPAPRERRGRLRRPPAQDRLAERPRRAR
jgi:hypothetical protein